MREKDIRVVDPSSSNKIGKAMESEGMWFRFDLFDWFIFLVLFRSYPILKTFKKSLHLVSEPLRSKRIDLNNQDFG